MQIAIIQFPGSTGEREIMLAVQRTGMEPVEFLWNEENEKLSQMAGFIIAGGFAYNDYPRAGAIAALDPIMQMLKEQNELGKPILGIGNGAQILVEAGLVPGLENNCLGMALTENKQVENGKVSTGYYNAWVHMRLTNQYQRNAFTRHLSPQRILHVPVAHSAGRFMMTPALLHEIENQGLNVFQYCDDRGAIIDSFPINPNGSIGNIAAIANKRGNVLAMMPHPERTQDGDAILQSMHDYIQAEHMQPVAPLSYYPRLPRKIAYQRPAHAYECVVESTVPDDHVLTVQNALRKLGFPVTVKRYVHWEIHCENAAVFAAIKKTGLLFNEHNEIDSPGKGLLVRSKDDLLGQQKLQSLQDHFLIKGLSKIYHDALWHFSYDETQMPTLMNEIFYANVISNPYAHDCFEYNA